MQFTMYMYLPFVVVVLRASLRLTACCYKALIKPTVSHSSCITKQIHVLKAGMFNMRLS